MFVKPRVFAAPHLSGPIGYAGMVKGCDPWGVEGEAGYCAGNHSCSPYEVDGKEFGCIDAQYCGGALAVIGVVAIIAGPLPGST